MIKRFASSSGRILTQTVISRKADGPGRAGGGGRAGAGGVEGGGWGRAGWGAGGASSGAGGAGGPGPGAVRGPVERIHSRRRARSPRLPDRVQAAPPVAGPTMPVPSSTPPQQRRPGAPPRRSRSPGVPGRCCRQCFADDPSAATSTAAGNRSSAGVHHAQPGPSGPGRRALALGPQRRLRPPVQGRPAELVEQSAYLGPVQVSRSSASPSRSAVSRSWSASASLRPRVPGVRHAVGRSDEARRAGPGAADGAHPRGPSTSRSREVPQVTDQPGRRGGRQACIATSLSEPPLHRVNRCRYPPGHHQPPHRLPVGHHVEALQRGRWRRRARRAPARVGRRRRAPRRVPPPRTAPGRRAMVPVSSGRRLSLHRPFQQVTEAGQHGVRLRRGRRRAAGSPRCTGAAAARSAPR